MFHFKRPRPPSLLKNKKQNYTTVHSITKQGYQVNSECSITIKRIWKQNNYKKLANDLQNIFKLLINCNIRKNVVPIESVLISRSYP